jgi:hypothetical protein
MFYELIGVVFAGVAAGGVASLLRRPVRVLPGWLVPLAAGGAMLLTAISLEYSWFGRTIAGLPEGVEVALTNESRAPWRPWTYVAPYTDRFVAVDRATVLTSRTVEGQRVAEVFLFARWNPTRQVRVAFDCAAGRQAPLVGGATISAEGRVDGVAWRETGLDDPVTRMACAA